MANLADGRNVKAKRAKGELETRAWRSKIRVMAGKQQEGLDANQVAHLLNRNIANPQTRGVASRRPSGVQILHKKPMLDFRSGGEENTSLLYCRSSWYMRTTASNKCLTKRT